MVLLEGLFGKSEYGDFGADSHDHFIANCFIDSIYLICLLDGPKLYCLHLVLEKVTAFSCSHK